MEFYSFVTEITEFLIVNPTESKYRSGNGHILLAHSVKRRTRITYDWIT